MRWKSCVAVGISLLLSACGGGSGGGSLGQNFVNNIVSELDGSSSLVNSYYQNINNLNSILSSLGSSGSLQAVFTNPNSKDIENAKALKSIINNAESLWSQSIQLLSQQSATRQYQIYSSTEYKEAYAAYLYLINHVKPIVEKVATGRNITLQEFNKVGNSDVATSLVNQEKNTSVDNSIVEKKEILKNTIDSRVAIDSLVSSTNQTGAEYTELAVTVTESEPSSMVSNGTPTSTSAYEDTTALLDNGDGTVTTTITRTTTVTTTTPKITVVSKIKTYTDKVYQDVTTTTITTPRTKITYGDGRYVIVNETASTNIVTTKTWVRDIVRNETIEISRSTEQIVASNTSSEVISRNTASKTVSSIVNLDPSITTSVQESEIYRVTTASSDSAETTTVTQGTPTSTSAQSNSTEDISNPDGSVTRNIYQITTVTTVTPTTTVVSKVRTYTDVYKKDITTTTTNTPNVKKIFTDGTFVQYTEAPVVTTEITTQIVETRQDRTETIIVSSNTEDVSATSNKTELVQTQLIQSPAYTDADPNLGNKTPGYYPDPVSYQTYEYLDKDTNGILQGWADGGKKQIKASHAYSRGWTGKGVKVAVADTGYDLDHTEFVGQVFATKDYTGTGMDDAHGHGTHVLGSMIAKKNNSGTHGVAFDATAAVIKIGNSSYVNISDAAKGFSWAADEGAIVGNLSANSNYDIFFRNSLSALSDGTYKSTDSRYDYSSGIFYNRQNPAEWKEATDKGLVIVNSAGNQGFAVSANPGYFATAVNSDGDLILGGKMLIAGAIDQNGNVASWSNKAGHICQNINTANNTCNDTYKVSDFYILAPGWTYSTANDGTYGTMAGTSMAAPYVTGGIALISQMWPYMKGENLVKLLTTTACKAACVKNFNVNIHGAGLIDLDQATRPVGAVGIPTSGRTTSSVSTVPIASSGGLGSSLSMLRNQAKLSKVMIVDEFARDFYVDMTKNIRSKDTRKLSDVNATLQGMPYLSFQQQYGSFEQGGQFPLPWKQFQLGMYSSTSGDGDWSTNLTKNWQLTNNLTMKTTFGFMSEQTTWLGNVSQGALAVGKNNNTKFTQLGAAYNYGSHTFSLDIAKGSTLVSTISNSLVDRVDPLQTQSIKIGWEQQLEPTTKWGVTYSLPNRITKGGIQLNVPYATTFEGEVIYDKVTADLRSNTPEVNIGVYYSHEPQEETQWKTKLSLEFRKNIAGVSGEQQWIPGIQFSKKF